MSALFQSVANINVAGNINKEICGEKILDFVKTIPNHLGKAELIATSIENELGFPESYSFVYPNLESLESSQITCASENPEQGPDEGNMEVVSIFPRLNKTGLSYQGKIQKIYVQKDTMEAIIELSYNEHQLYFFDLDFVKNWHHYDSNHSVQAVIYGIAHNATLSDSHLTKTITINENMAAALNKKVGETIEVVVGEVRYCLPRADIKEDGYIVHEFRGKIHSVREVTLPQTKSEGWICAVDCLWTGSANGEPSKKDIVEVYLAKHSWQENKTPKVDDYLSGFILLCGFINN